MLDCTSIRPFLCYAQTRSFLANTPFLGFSKCDFAQTLVYKKPDRRLSPTVGLKNQGNSDLPVEAQYAAWVHWGEVLWDEVNKDLTYLLEGIHIHITTTAKAKTGHC